jgi:hypothetical protein
LQGRLGFKKHAILFIMEVLCVCEIPRYSRDLP